MASELRITPPELLAAEFAHVRALASLSKSHCRTLCTQQLHVAHPGQAAHVHHWHS